MHSHTEPGVDPLLTAACIEQVKHYSLTAQNPLFLRCIFDARSVSNRRHVDDMTKVRSSTGH